MEGLWRCAALLVVVALDASRGSSDVLKTYDLDVEQFAIAAVPNTNKVVTLSRSGLTMLSLDGSVVYELGLANRTDYGNQIHFINDVTAVVVCSTDTQVAVAYVIDFTDPADPVMTHRGVDVLSASKLSDNHLLLVTFERIAWTADDKYLYVTQVGVYPYQLYMYQWNTDSPATWVQSVDTPWVYVLAVEETGAFVYAAVPGGLAEIDVRDTNNIVVTVMDTMNLGRISTMFVVEARLYCIPYQTMLYVFDINREDLHEDESSLQVALATQAGVVGPDLTSMVMYGSRILASDGSGSTTIASLHVLDVVDFAAAIKATAQLGHGWSGAQTGARATGVAATSEGIYLIADKINIEVLPWSDFPDPGTRVPATVAPPTGAPHTAAPQPPPTETPLTRAPMTHSPTVAPDTEVPPTGIPDTEVPTVAPDTEAPPTSAPPTRAPPTLSPTAPPTTAPTSVVPDTGAPATAPPITDAPMTALSTSVPDTGAPTTTPPDTDAPTTTLPDTQPPHPQDNTTCAAVHGTSGHLTPDLVSGSFCWDVVCDGDVSVYVWGLHAAVETEAGVPLQGIAEGVFMRYNASVAEGVTIRADIVGPAVLGFSWGCNVTAPLPSSQTPSGTLAPPTLAPIPTETMSTAFIAVSNPVSIFVKSTASEYWVYVFGMTTARLMVVDHEAYAGAFTYRMASLDNWKGAEEIGCGVQGMQGLGGESAAVLCDGTALYSVSTSTSDISQKGLLYDFSSPVTAWVVQGSYVYAVQVEKTVGVQSFPAAFIILEKQADGTYVRLFWEPHIPAGSEGTSLLAVNDHYALWCNGTHLYAFDVHDKRDCTLQIYNMEDKEHMGAALTGMSVDATHLYAVSANRFAVFELHDKGKPVLVASEACSVAVSGLQVVDDMAFVFGEDSTIVAMNMSNLADLRKTRYQGAGEGRAFAAANNVVFSVMSAPQQGTSTVNAIWLGVPEGVPAAPPYIIHHYELSMVFVVVMAILNTCLACFTGTVFYLWYTEKGPFASSVDSEENDPDPGTEMGKSIFTAQEFDVDEPML